MDSSYTRSGLTVLSNDGSDAVTAYRTSIRNLAAWAEANGAMYAQGLLSARPTAGKAGRIYRATNDSSGVVYYDDGETWQSIGANPPTDAAAGVGSLRTLGSGSVQAAAGNHTHAIGAITGAGDAAAKNTGTSTGTVAAGDHTHTGSTLSGVVSVQYVTKASATSRTSTVAQAADPDLALALGSTGTYRIAALLGVSGASTSDFAMSWSFGGTAALKFRGGRGPSQFTSAVTNGSMISEAATAGGLSFTLAYGVDGTSNSSYIHEELILAVTATGTLSLLWGQNSSGSATQIDAGSTLIAEKIA